MKALPFAAGVRSLPLESVSCAGRGGRRYPTPQEEPAKEKMTRNRRLNIEEGALARFCEKHHIRRLSLFGSQLKGTARADSDVDLLVEFDPEHIPRLLGIASMESELSDMFGGVGGGGGGAAPAGCEGSGTDGGVAAPTCASRSRSTHAYQIAHPTTSSGSSPRTAGR